MISITRVDPPGYSCVTPSEPFEFSELVARGIADANDLGFEEVFGRPLLMDFRKVNLLRFSSDDFQRAISKRYQASNGFLNVPCALVAADETSFGMLRMYGSYMEARNLRDDTSIFLTTDFAAAEVWIRRAATQLHLSHTRSI